MTHSGFTCFVTASNSHKKLGVSPARRTISLARLIRFKTLLCHSSLLVYVRAPISGSSSPGLPSATNGPISFIIYIKTKNFHWHVSGPHFRDYHLLLDEQAEQVFTMTDDIAERIRMLGGTTIRSIGHVARLKHVADNDAEFVEPQDMISELREDNQHWSHA